MNSSMNNYLTIEEASVYTEKSLSSIRRLVKELKQNNSKSIKFETLKTGHKKVFISVSFLNIHFNINDLNLNDSTNSSMNSSMNDSVNSSMNNSNEDLKDVFINKTLDLLQKELEEKNRQIESLLQRQYETNVILEQLQQKTKLLEVKTDKPKKRWWWQKKD